MYPRCDSKHPVCMSRSRAAPGGVGRWNTSTPRTRGGGLQCPPSVGSRLGTASWRALAPDLRVCVYPGSVRALDAAARLAGRAASTMTAGRSVSTRPGHRHLTFCDRETSAFASAAVRLALLSRDRGSLHRAVPSRRDESPLCRICLRDHPRAPPCFTLDPRWVHTALGQVRCEPVSASS